ncbi:MAG TPA: MBL fold metallo-hydrolase [Chitinophagaceae bacterium]|nr:MBL fold metallo-hydrolase [Chitinophagaceae bacterium]
MSLYISSLNSGSNGNCYYIGNNKEAVLIDAGLSCRETEKRMQRQGLSMSLVKAIFVSHEHTDHITGISTLSKKYGLPVYITAATLNNSNLSIPKHLIHSFKTDKSIPVGSLSITAFRKSHDASDPHSFIVSNDEVNIGVFTDIGYPGKELIRHFKLCHAAFLESNYCEDMLENGSYPRHLKKRISGKKGHLSNAQALELFIKHRPKQLTHLILSHLSENNNDPGLVNKIFKPHAGTTKIIVASRYEETGIFYVKPNLVSLRKRISPKSQPIQKQLSLFG